MSQKNIKPARTQFIIIPIIPLEIGQFIDFKTFSTYYETNTLLNGTRFAKRPNLTPLTTPRPLAPISTACCIGCHAIVCTQNAAREAMAWLSSREQIHIGLAAGAFKPASWSHSWDAIADYHTLLPTYQRFLGATRMCRGQNNDLWVERRVGYLKTTTNDICDMHNFVTMPKQYTGGARPRTVTVRQSVVEF